MIIKEYVYKKLIYIYIYTDVNWCSKINKVHRTYSKIPANIVYSEAYTPNNLLIHNVLVTLI